MFSYHHYHGIIMLFCNYLFIYLFPLLNNKILEGFYFFRFYLFIFRERKGGRKRGRETSMCGSLLARSPPGTWPEPQARALKTGNRNSNPLVGRLVLNPLNHTSQGSLRAFYSPDPDCLAHSRYSIKVG